MFTDNKIYLSEKNKCTMITDKIILLKETNNFLYEKGAIDDSSYDDSGLIFVCDEICKQEYNDYILDEVSKTLFHCDFDGLCMKTNFINNGYLLGKYDETDMTYKKLIHCSSEWMYDCNYVDILPGYYINGSWDIPERFIVYCFDNTSCVLIKLSIYFDYYYYTDASNSKNIITCNYRECYSEIAQEGYYLNSGYMSYDVNQIIKCDGKICKTIKYEDGYYYSVGKCRANGNDPTIIKCYNNECFYIEYNYSENYYLHGDTSDPEKLIFKCDKTKCYYYKINEGYYINADSSKINLDDALLLCTSNKCSITKGNSGYFINGGGSDKKDFIIECNTTCKSIKPEVGYYLNSGIDNLKSPIISCDNTSCKLIKSNSNCNNVGNVILTKSNIKFCISKNDTEALNLNMDINSTKYKYKIIKIENDNDFPESKAGNILVKISDNGRINLIRETSLPICDNITGSRCMNSKVGTNSYCIKDNLIYISEYDKCRIIYSDDLYNDSKILYLGINNSKNNNPGSISISMAYKCTLKSIKTIEYCSILKGYIFEDYSLINCNGWNDNYCSYINIYDLKQCEEGDEGKLGIFFMLCFGTRGLLLPFNSNEERYIAFTTTKLNTYYGKYENEIVILSLSSTHVIVSSLKGKKKKKLISNNIKL